MIGEDEFKDRSLRAWRRFHEQHGLIYDEPGSLGVTINRRGVLEITATRGARGVTARYALTKTGRVRRIYPMTVER